MMFYFVLNDSTIVRQTHPRRPELEIYRGHGQWDPYHDLESWKAIGKRVSETTAEKLIARHDAIGEDF